MNCLGLDWRKWISVQPHFVKGDVSFHAVKLWDFVAV